MSYMSHRKKARYTEYVTTIENTIMGYDPPKLCACHLLLFLFPILFHCVPFLFLFNTRRFIYLSCLNHCPNRDTLLAGHDTLKSILLEC